MIKRFCDRCETELSKGDYVYLSMNGYGLNKHNNKNNVKSIIYRVNGRQSAIKILYFKYYESIHGNI